MSRKKPGRKYHRLERTCSACGVEIRDRNTTGQCRTCWLRASNTDPELNLRRIATMKRQRGPGGELHDMVRQRLAAARAKRDPDQLREKGYKLARHMLNGDREKQRRNHIEAMRRTRHQWLPDEWRDTYRAMLRNHGYTAPEAKEIILETIAREKARARNLAKTKLPAEKCTINNAVNAIVGSNRLRDAILEAAR